MTQQDHERIAELFSLVCDLDSDERKRVLDEEGVVDPTIVGQIESLVEADRYSAAGALTDLVGKAALRVGQARLDGDAGADQVVVGPYRILEHIAGGAFGDVYLADQTEPVRRRVALKVLKRGMDTRSVLARFEAESQALAMMDHPNIATVFDAGETPRGRPYFVMEYVPGMAITKYCDHRRLTTRQRLELFMQTCRAVQHAHGRGIIHRDLKPSNILVAETDGEASPKVIDFGIAKATTATLTERTIYTMHEQIMGTPAYMSPEQVEADGLDVDTRSDVYSLGVVLYELIAGAQPIDSSQLVSAGRDEMRRVIRDKDPARPSARVSEADGTGALTASQRNTEPAVLSRQLRGELDWITMKALEKDRTRRYETASALAADIGRYLNGEAVEAGPPSALYRFGKFARRHKLAFGAAAALFTGTIVAAGALFYALVDSNRQRAHVQAALEETQQARAAAEAVTSFLTGMLSAANPTRQGRDVTVVDVLDVAVDGIPRDFGDRPSIEARLRQTIGGTYYELGQFDAAVEQLERAVALNTTLYGENAPATLFARRDLAGSYRDRGDLETAETQLHDIVGRQDATGADNGSLAPSLDQLGSVLILQGRYTEAEPIQVRADTVARSAFGDNDPRRAEILATLGVLQLLLGRTDEARMSLAHALDVLRREYGPDYPTALDTAANLATVYFQVGEYELAAEQFSQVADSRARVLGDEHADTLQARSDLSVVLSNLGRLAEAERIGNAVLEARLRTLGPEHPSTLQSMNNVATNYRAMGQLSDAEELLRESLAIKDRVLGPDHPNTIITRGNYGAILAEMGRAEEGLPVLEAALASAERALPEDHPRRNDVLRKLGECQRQLGRNEEAERTLLNAHAALESKVGADHKYTRRAAQSLAALYDSLGQSDVAAGWRAKQ